MKVMRLLLFIICTASLHAAESEQSNNNNAGQAPIADAQCTVCHESLIAKGPRPLLCNHDLCIQCCNTWVAEKGDSAACPTCRHQLFFAPDLKRRNDIWLGAELGNRDALQKLNLTSEEMEGLRAILALKGHIALPYKETDRGIRALLYLLADNKQKEGVLSNFREVEKQYALFSKQHEALAAQHTALQSKCNLLAHSDAAQLAEQVKEQGQKLQDQMELTKQTQNRALLAARSYELEIATRNTTIDEQSEKIRQVLKNVNSWKALHERNLIERACFGAAITILGSIALGIIAGKVADKKFKCEESNSIFTGVVTCFAGVLIGLFVIATWYHKQREHIPTL